MMKHPRSIAITSGKGGVGKTNIAVNLSIALQRRRERVALFDADLALANAHIVLGCKAQRTMADAFTSDTPLKDILSDGPGGVKLVAGGSGLSELMDLSPENRHRIISSFRDLATEIDTLVVDTAAGIEANVVDFVAASDRVIVVVVGEPTAFVDAYAAIKVLHQETGRTNFDVIVNRARDEAHGQDVFKRFRAITDKFLTANLHHIGSVPQDPRLVQAVTQRKPVLLAHPDCPASRAIERIADVLTGKSASPVDDRSGGFFPYALAGARTAEAIP